MSLIIVKGQKYQNLATEYSNVLDYDNITIDNVFNYEFDTLTLVYDFNGNYTVPFFTENNDGGHFYFSSELIEIFHKVKQVNLISENLNNNLFLNEVNQIAQELNIQITTNLTINDIELVKNKLITNNLFSLKELINYNKKGSVANDLFDISLIEMSIDPLLEQAINNNKKKKGITLDKLPTKYFQVNKNNNGGYNCQLLNNINLKDLGWKDSNTYIKLNNNDIFDGSDYEISVSWENQGIFGSSCNSKDKSPIIKNLIVNSKNNIAKKDNSFGGGIVISAQQYFIVDKCTSMGNIGHDGGGICGAFCGHNGNIQIKNSIFNGNIGIDIQIGGGGGICGIGCGYKGDIEIDNCIINGKIGVSLKNNVEQFEDTTSSGILNYVCGISGNTKITNCVINADITEGFNSGICGSACCINSNVKIDKCTINGTLNNYTNGVMTFLSGVKSNILITNFTVNGNIYSGANGICGSGTIMYADLKIINCKINGNLIYNRNKFTDLVGLPNNIIGANGLCGQGSCGFSNILIDNCQVSGEIDKFCNGICGSCGLGGSVIIKNSFSTGKIKSFGSGIANLLSITNEIIPNKSNYTIINCYSTGEIESYAGGIINMPIYSNCKIINCYSTGLINEGAGGIVGIYAGYNGGTKNGNCTITNCYSTGDISGNYAGGICGDFRSNIKSTNLSNKIIDIWTEISKLAKIKFVPSSSLVINNCYSTGKILYPNKLSGGIIGNCLDKCAINNSYSTNTNLTNSIDNKNTSLSVFNSYCNGKIANKTNNTSKIYYNSKKASTTIPTLNLTPITNQLDTSNQVDNIGPVKIGILTVTPSKWNTIKTWNVPSESTTDNDTYPTLKPIP